MEIDQKWHLFNIWSVFLAGLPRKVNAQMPNIHFLTCLDSVGVLDMAEPIVEELLHLEQEGTVVYDAYLESNVLVVAPILCAIVDNPVLQRW